MEVMVKEHGKKLDSILTSQDRLLQSIAKHEHLQIQIDDNKLAISQARSEIKGFDDDLDLFRLDLNNFSAEHKSRWWVITTLATVAATAAGLLTRIIF